ncbi:hypothetical protein DFP93_12635 [Aneurinibacillus soli]|uniref:Uncharacterized protein n=1 Tax=Aneurinibacillus soli TaxID=1500254 RepID=A0A0U5B2R8_9BACL|nr:hypothetical protein [Aneurinibacillus soli]PYE58058.1 hypothetical protein DFP93_12635 [Aneurinibacillus soli]BAU25958.1 hypothetical protein CB4_00009 [Aneurinibacillus soli]
MDRKITPITLAELERRHATLKEPSDHPISTPLHSVSENVDESGTEEKVIDEP